MVNAVEGTLDALSSGKSSVVIVDRRRRLICASPAGHDLLCSDQGIELRDGIVSGAVARDEAAIGTAIRKVVTSNEANSTVVGANADSGGVRLTFSSLNGVGKDISESGGMHIAIIAAAEGRGSVQRTAAAIARFRLTGAEGRVLSLLCQGRSLQEVAPLLSIARTTARTHLQRIFDKTCARRQSDLMRLVLAPGDTSDPIEYVS